MHYVFQRFVDGLNDSHDPKGFRSTLEEAALALDLPCFAYARMPAQIDGAVSLIASYPSVWTDHYFECHYEALDPVILMAHESVEPFVWGEEWNGPGLTERQKAFFEEAAAFGIRCGFTIPIRDGDGPIAAVTFASSEKRESFVRSITVNRRVLQLMAISLHCHARRKLWPSNVVAGVRLSARFGFKADAYDPHDNIFAGTAYLHELYVRYGYPNLFAAYQAGPSRLDDYLLRGRPLPSVTKAYVAALTGARSARITTTNTDGEVVSARPETALFFVNHAGNAPTSSTAASSSLFVPLTSARR